MKRNFLTSLCVPVLSLALLASLAGCGSEAVSGFRVLETVGVRRYGLIYRLDDRLAPVVDAAMVSLEADGTLSDISRRWLGRDAISLKNTDSAAQETEAPAPSPEETPSAGGAEAGNGAEAEAHEAAENAAPAGAAGEGAEVETAERRLIFGVEQDFVPMAFEESGTLRGMSVDLGTALGRSLGWEVAFQPIAPGEVETQLASGNIDCALGFDPATVRTGRYTLGVSYMESDVVVAVRADSEYRRFRDIQGQRVGTIEDPVIVSLLRENEKVSRYASGATVYLSAQRCLNALDYGWCGAIAMDRLMLDHM